MFITKRQPSIPCLSGIGLAILGLICFLGLPSLSMATTYYVAKDGMDSYNGLYPFYQGGANGPFLTISRAAGLVVAGDVVEVREGTYHEKVTVSANGTASKRIILTSYNGEMPVIDGAYTLPGGSVYYFLVNILGDYVTISDITIKRSSGSLLAVFGDYSQAIGITGAGSRESGIVAGGIGNLLDGCGMTDNGNGYGIAGQATWGSAICTVGANTTIQNCIAYENRGEGINAYRYSTKALIQDNVSYNNRSYNLYLDSTVGAVVRRNLVYQTKTAYNMYGITIGAETGQPSSLYIYNNVVRGCKANFHVDSNVTVLNGVKVVYNTFADSTGPVAEGYNMGVYFRPDVGTYSDSLFENNIVTEEDVSRVPIFIEISHPGLTFASNCWNKNPVVAASGEGDVTADPLLAKTGTTDAGMLNATWFKILEDSPARDRARVQNDVLEDFYKTPRGSAPDIGPFEISFETSDLAAAVTATPLSGQAPLDVAFAPSVSGGVPPYAYRWSFGDGGSSVEQSPLHTYTTPGIYTAVLIATDSASTSVSSAVSIQAAEDAQPLSSAVAASSVSGQTPFAVNFTGAASGGKSPYTYQWAFGDGGVSAAQNPSHTYTSAGTYTATLTVTDSASTTSKSTLSILVTAETPALSASAAASSISGQTPLAVFFTGTAKGGKPPYFFQWTFGDGGVSSAQNPSHTYTSAGTFTATLTVKDSASTTAGASVIIKITAPLPLKASIAVPLTTGPAPLAIDFAGSASGGVLPYSYSWSFGDGGSSTDQNPKYTYMVPGSYTVVLTVKDGRSASATAKIGINVRKPSKK